MFSISMFPILIPIFIALDVLDYVYVPYRERHIATNVQVICVGRREYNVAKVHSISTSREPHSISNISQEAC